MMKYEFPDVEDVHDKNIYTLKVNIIVELKV